MGFFDDNVLLRSETARRLYSASADHPIIDYHCHLDPGAIARDDPITDIGELWLAHDHYKWRAMRLCGVDEYYITGGASYAEKFMKYAEIMPMLAGGPLYYFTHFELKQIFGVTEPLGPENAARLYEECNGKLSGMRVSDLLKKYRVRVVATTDDPADDLIYHGKYGDTAVVPTFRPDKYYCPDDAALERLGKAAGIQIVTLRDLLDALTDRLAYFISKGCFMSDHGFEKFPPTGASYEEAAELFLRRGALSDGEKQTLFGYVLTYLLRQYKKRGITAQLHFSVRRNVNAGMFAVTGADSGFDVIGDPQTPSDVERFLASFADAERPDIVLYTLNDMALRALASISGAFSNVRIGAAWWFNDTKLGIRRMLETASEYAVLGTSLGMLTDSRSFAGYSRFDFFRRILCDYIAELVDGGEYPEDDAAKLIYDINIGNAYKAACGNPYTASLIGGI